jgi:hypothetical protein
MIKTAIDFDHNFSMKWENKDDMVRFLKEFVVPNARRFGFKVTWEEVEGKKGEEAHAESSDTEPVSIRA